MSSAKGLDRRLPDHPRSGLPFHVEQPSSTPPATARPRPATAAAPAATMWGLWAPDAGLSDDAGRRASPRFALLDALRGLAALGVLIYHLATYYSLLNFGRYADFVDHPTLQILKHTQLGVQVFFVLSGFVIAHSLMGKPFGRRDLAGFVVRRSIRLDPPYWATIALTLGVIVAGRVLGTGTPDAMPTGGQIAATLVYLQGILRYEYISPVFWTLCIEVQLYLTYCVMLILAGRRMPLLLVAALALSLAWPIGWFERPLAPVWFISEWYLFLLGALARFATDMRFAGDLRRLGPVLAGAIALTLVSGLWHHDGRAIVGAGAATLITLASAAGRLKLSLGRAMQFFGRISYSLYLTHWLVVSRVMNLGHPISSDPVWQAAVIALAGGLSVAFAWLFWWAIEQPSVRASKRVQAWMDRRANARTHRDPPQADNDAAHDPAASGSRSLERPRFRSLSSSEQPTL